MNREDIIKLARKVSNTPIDHHATPDLFGVAQIERFATLVAADENEACAKAVDAAKSNDQDWDTNDWNQAVEFCASRIRARSNT